MSEPTSMPSKDKESRVLEIAKDSPQWEEAQWSKSLYYDIMTKAREQVEIESSQGSIDASDEGDTVHAIEPLDKEALMLTLAASMPGWKDADPGSEIRDHCIEEARAHLAAIEPLLDKFSHQMWTVLSDAHRMSGLLSEMETTAGYDSAPQRAGYTYRGSDFKSPGARARHYGQDAVVVDGDWLLYNLQLKDEALAFDRITPEVITKALRKHRSLGLVHTALPVEQCSCGKLVDYEKHLAEVIVRKLRKAKNIIEAENYV